VATFESAAAQQIAVRSIPAIMPAPTGIRVEAEISNQRPGRIPEPAPSSGDGDRRPVRLQLKTVSGDIRVERTA
jgi:hypothetical protein